MAKITLLNNEQMITSLGAEVPDIKVKYQETESGLFVRKYHATLSYASTHPNWGATIQGQWNVTEFIDEPRNTDAWERIADRFFNLARQANDNIELRCPELEQKVKWDLEEKIYRTTSIVTAAPRVFYYFTTNIKGARVDEATQKVRQAERSAQEQQRAAQRKLEEEEEERQRKITQAQEAQKRNLEQAQRQITQTTLEGAITNETEVRYKIATAITTNNHFDYALTRADIRSMVAALFDSNDNLQVRPIGSNKKDGEWAKLIKEVVGEQFYKRLFGVEEDMDTLYMRVLEHVKTAIPSTQTPPPSITKQMYESAIRSASNIEDITELFTRDRIVQTEMLSRVEKKLAEGPIDFQKAYNSLLVAMSLNGGLYTCTAYNVPSFVIEPAPCKTNEQFADMTRGIQQRFEEHIGYNKTNLRFIGGKNTDMDIDELMYVGPDIDDFLRTGSLGKRHGWDTWNGSIKVKFSVFTGKRPQNDEHDVPWIKTANLRVVRSVEKLEITPSEMASRIVSQASDIAIKSATDSRLVTVQEQLRSYHPRLSEEQQFTQLFTEKMLERFQSIFTQGSENPTHTPNPAPVSESQ